MGAINSRIMQFARCDLQARLFQKTLIDSQLMAPPEIAPVSAILNTDQTITVIQFHEFVDRLLEIRERCPTFDTLTDLDS